MSLKSKNTGLVPGCYTLSCIPGREIKASLGVIEYTLTFTQSEPAEKVTQAFEGLLERALSQGAHSVVNVRLETSIYRPFFGIDSTILFAYGEAVLVE
ncbi:heavy metal-binding domain-containing protein [Salinivibrio sp. VYel1]|uniref:heavy metal-binding domain-containing protein n=1 Tax=Salinivibrio sp. VYel1 TaxID=2490490 RepID=UPI00128D41B2|nr:heavy metal-binding domain-containing protein [Salinivibrio sp. VYel1]MPX91409.1 hypothetical protein [Salinivibrio sp. VYel1]